MSEQSMAPDIDVLGAVVAASTGQGVTAVRDLERLSGGSSREIWAFAVDLADGATRRLVLRRDPPAEARPGGLALETTVMRAAQTAGVPVPEIFDGPDGVDGADLGGIVMERVDAETSPARILERADLADARATLAAQCGAALGRLHGIDAAHVPSLPTEDRLVAYRETLDRLGGDRPVLELAHEWLVAERPAARPAVLVHGDFRLGNLAVDERGLVAVFDWESAHVGDRLEDLGWIAVNAWRFRGPGVIGGFGDVEPFLAAYAHETGVRIGADEFAWALVLNTWIWAVGCLQQADRHLSGAQRSLDLAMVGRRVVEIEHDLLELIDPTGAAGSEATPRPAIVSGAPHGVPHGARHGVPTLDELIEAVEETLRNEVMPSASGREHHLLRLATAALAQARRDVVLAPAIADAHARRLLALGVESDADLAAQIRAGEVTADRRSAVVAALRAHVREQLAIVAPRHPSAASPGRQ